MSQKRPEDKDNPNSELRRKLREHQARQRAQQQSAQPTGTPPAPKRPPAPKPQPAQPPEQPTQPSVRTYRQAAPVLEPQPQPTRQGRLGMYIPWWGFALVALVIAAVTCGIWALVLTSRSDLPLGGAGLTPTFLVITNTPTQGAPEIIQAVPEIVTATPEPTIEDDAPQATQDLIEIGGEVTIVNTEGDGLSIRQGPGLQYAYFFVGRDGEVFDVQDGPRESDGFVWWYIADPDIPDKAGWAVQDFMEGSPQGVLKEATPGGPSEEAGSDG